MTKAELAKRKIELRNQIESHPSGKKYMRFIQYQLEGRRKGESYQKAFGPGISSNSASVGASKVLKRPEIKEYIETMKELETFVEKVEEIGEIYDSDTALAMLSMNAMMARAAKNWTASNNALKELLAWYKWQTNREDELNKGAEQKDLAELVKEALQTPRFEEPKRVQPTVTDTKPH